MRRLSAVVAVAGIVLASVSAAPADASAPQPRTRAAAVKAAKASGWKVAAAVGNAASAARGVAYLDVSLGGPGGCGQVWAYGHGRWGALGVCSQEVAIYPHVLPGTLRVCAGTTGTVLRSGPGFGYAVRAKLSKDRTLTTDQVVLALPATSKLDGVAWYRVRYAGRTSWVVSFRVAAPDAGCGYWKDYWSGGQRHR